MYLTKKTYLEKIKKLNSKYWNEGKNYRWEYISIAVSMMQSCGHSTLEAGVMGLPLNDNSFIIDLSIKDLKTKKKKRHDLNVVPYNFFVDKQFDCVCMLQVFEHLDNHPEIFRELCRISDNIVLSFPYKWNHGDERHRGIDETKIAKWTDNKSPDQVVKVKSRIIYFWKNV